MLERKLFVKRSNWIFAVLMDMIGNLIFIKRRTLLLLKPKKILILRTDGIGDTLLTTPLIRSLKVLYPDAAIDLLIRPSSKEILEGNSNVSNLITSNSLWYDLFNAFKLRKDNYDIVISPRTDRFIMNHFMSFLIGGTQRVGYAMKGGGFFLTDVVPWKGEAGFLRLLQDIILTIDRDKRLFQIKVEENGKFDFPYSKYDDEYIDNLLRENGIIAGDIIIGINPFASHRIVWPINNFIDLMNNMNKLYNTKIVFIGDNKSKTKYERIRKDVSGSVILLAGQTNLKQLAALIKRFTLLITNDSGPRHIANTVDTPVIVLRNLANSNVLWGKYCDNEHIIFHNVPCAPCGKNNCPEKLRICLTNIKVEEVMKIVQFVFVNSFSRSIMGKKYLKTYEIASSGHD